MMPVVRSADTNRDGRLDPREARAAFDSLFPGMPVGKAYWAVVRPFRSQRWLQGRRAAWAWEHIWHLFDKDNDGKLSDAELLRVAQVSLPARTQFHHVQQPYLDLGTQPVLATPSGAEEAGSA